MALDPELLGKVFENLLAFQNDEEARITARKQTGSFFYTPRAVVGYMVDATLKPHLADVLTCQGMSATDARAGLDVLFAYTQRMHPFSAQQAAALTDAIYACRSSTRKRAVSTRCARRRASST
ncbi:putative type IIS restriction /modification enzyme, N-terminal half [Candidatus Paraburkholderia calva]|nr:putative type IIS restriction /modification enzyme, N-terminal half [Candidatus Paraburkholderia calva]